MAIINCKECGKEISEKAKTCHNCGNPNSVKQSSKDSIDDKTAGIIIVVILVIVCFFGIIGNNRLNFYKCIENKNGIEYNC